MPPPLSTNDWYGSKKRPDEFGPVLITFEEIPHMRGPIVRPISVEGICAVGKTTGRPNAKEPLAGVRVSQAKAVPVMYRYDAETGDNAYNTGIPDAEKGHIMALELGGPDIKENIVPQWAKWQGSGEWRRMETAIMKMAKEGYEAKDPDRFLLQFHAIVGYKTYKRGMEKYAMLRSVAFPSRFKVIVTKLDPVTKNPTGAAPKIMYDGSPMRNETDDMLFMRTMMTADLREFGDTMETYSDWETVKKGTKRKPIDAGNFVATGQNPIFRPPPVKYRLRKSDVTAYREKIGAKIELEGEVFGSLLDLAGKTLPDEMEEDADYSLPGLPAAKRQRK